MLALFMTTNNFPSTSSLGGLSLEFREVFLKGDKPPAEGYPSTTATLSSVDLDSPSPFLLEWVKDSLNTPILFAITLQ